MGCGSAKEQKNNVADSRRPAGESSEYYDSDEYESEYEYEEEEEEESENEQSAENSKSQVTQNEPQVADTLPADPAKNSSNLPVEIIQVPDSESHDSVSDLDKSNISIHIDRTPTATYQPSDAESDESDSATSTNEISFPPLNQPPPLIPGPINIQIPDLEAKLPPAPNQQEAPAFDIPEASAEASWQSETPPVSVAFIDTSISKAPIDTTNFLKLADESGSFYDEPASISALTLNSKMPNLQPIKPRETEKRPYEPQFQTALSEESIEESEDERPTIIDTAKAAQINKVDIESMRVEFQERLARERLDPRMFTVRVAFVLDGPDGLGRRLYEFYIYKGSGCVSDIKKQITEDFGYTLIQQKLYYKNKELADHQIILRIEDFDAGKSVLLFGALSLPEKAPLVHLRPKTRETEIDDIRNMNCTEGVIWNAFKFLDDSKLQWPPYREWSNESFRIYERIRKLNSHMDLEKSFECQAMNDLVQAEKELQILISDFKAAAQHTVHVINRWKPDSLGELGGLFGQGGDKIISGGMIVRKVANWHSMGVSVPAGPNANELANHELRTLNFLRGLIPSLEVPLACIVDYYGMMYLCQALMPIATGSLAYGSSTDGVFIFNHDEATHFAEKIAEQLNLKSHDVIETHSGRQINLKLPFSVELHLGGKENSCYYLINSQRLLCPFVEEDLHTETTEEKLLMKRLRPELVIQNTQDKIDENYQKQTWKNPRQCSECSEWIQEYDYWYYEKRNLDANRSLLKTYFCCVKCYAELATSENFQVPLAKMKKRTVPEQQRETFWMHTRTKERKPRPPGAKIPLNPDAFTDINRSEETDKAEVIQLSVKLQEKVIPQFVELLSTLSCMPLDSRQLAKEMHARGISMRFLGRIALTTQHNFIKELAVREVLVRTIKILIRDGLSFLIEDENGFNHEDVRKSILHYFNEIFTLDERKSSAKTWEYITSNARKKFGITVEKDSLERTHATGLLISLCSAIKVKLTHYTGYNYNHNYPFVLEDIQEVFIRCKMPKPSSYALNRVFDSARTFDDMGKRSRWYYSGSEERSNATNLLLKAQEVALEIYGSGSEQVAEANKILAENYESRHVEKGRPEYSKWNPAAGIPDDELASQGRKWYERSIQHYEAALGPYCPEIADCYLGLAKLNKTTKLHRDMSLYSNNPVTEASENPMFAYLFKAIEIMEITIGIDHPETAELYLKLALAYQESGIVTEASRWIRRSFWIFVKSFPISDEIVQFTHEYLLKIEIHMSSNLENVPIENLKGEIERIEFDINNRL